MITAQLVKELRERTGISMMDCKNALTETNGDVDAAIEVLRKKSVLKAEKKADRATNEGALVVGVADTYGFIVEVNTETDFAAKDQDFQEFLNVLREYCIANKPGSLEELNDYFNYYKLNTANYWMDLLQYKSEAILRDFAGEKSNFIVTAKKIKDRYF